jgi:tetratricopeptide (TPR) repeat protein
VGKRSQMSPADEERLLSEIDDSDAVLREEGDSEDPVAARHVTEALATKASALSELGRHAQAVSVLDELIARHWNEPSAKASLLVMTALYFKACELEPDGHHRESLEAVAELLELSGTQPQDDRIALLLTRARAVRARALAAVGSIDDSVACADEIVADAAASLDPERQQWAAWALEHESRILIASGRFDEALNASMRLPSLLLDAEPEALVRVVEIINNHSMLLVQVGASSPNGVMRFLMLTLINTASPALDAVVSRSTLRRRPGFPGSAHAPSALSTRRSDVVASARWARRRAQQARAASQAVIERIGSSDDPEPRRCAASAEYIAGTALVVAGHPIAGLRAVQRFTDRHDLDAIQAFQHLNRSYEHDTSLAGELGSISAAALRAGMLGDGDQTIAKIAYEDSIAGRLASSAHPTLSRLYARWLAPEVDKTTEADSP